MLAEHNVRRGFFELDQFQAILKHLPSEYHALFEIAVPVCLWLQMQDPRLRILDVKNLIRLGGDRARIHDHDVREVSRDCHVHSLFRAVRRTCASVGDSAR